MISSSFSDLIFDPLLPYGFIIIITLIFFASLGFAIFNKSSGIFYRVFLFSIIIFIFLQPSLKIENRKIENDILTFIIDETESQNITKRIKPANQVYKNFLEEIGQLSGFDILEIKVKQDKIYKRFGNYQQIINNKLKTEVIPNKSLYSSRFINNLEKSLNQFPQKKLSSIFIITDGQIHDLKKKEKNEKINLPVYFILPGEKKINDKKLSVISYPEFGYLNEEITIKVKAEDFFEDNDAELDVYIENGSSEKKNYKIKNNEIKTITFKLKKAGENLIKVFIEPTDGELSKSNNYELLKISGIRKKLRVLLVSGEPYMGTRVWRNFLKSDPSVELIHMTVLRTPEKNDNTPTKELSLIPFPTKELFEEKLKDFQLIIFDNFKGKNVLSPLYIENILKFVDSGGAVLEITGPSYNSKNSLFRTAIGSILPGAPTGSVIKRPFKPTLSDIGKIHPITKSIFKNFDDYGTWFQMNKITDLDKKATTLLLGDNKNPLLVINKFSKGRIAQIYSHHLWLWTKSSHNNGGPYNLLIKNLAHWLMKEPSLEENKIEVNIIKNNLFVKKKFLTEPQKDDLEIILTTPKGKKIKKKLFKNTDKIYSTSFNFKDNGLYLISDGNIDKSINTDTFKKLEYKSLNLTDNLILSNPISNFITKPFWIDEDKLPDIKETENLKKDFKNNNTIYLKRNNNFIVNGTETKILISHEVSIFFLIIFLVLCWKKESV